MTFTAVPWDGQPPMLEAQYRKLWGVFPDRLLKIGSLSFSASAREVTWSGATAVFQGAVATQSGTDTWTIPTWAGTNKRFYYGVLRYDPAANTVTPQLAEGQLSANPSSPGIGPSGPTFRDEDGKWDLIVWRLGPASGTGAASTLSPEDMRQRPTRVRYALNPAMLYTMGLIAETGDVCVTLDDVFVWNGTAWTRPRTPDTASGHANVNFGAGGVGVITHGLGWTPDAMTFTPHLSSGTGGDVIVAARAMTTPYNNTTAQIVAKVASTGAAYTLSLTRVDWIAHRNL